MFQANDKNHLPLLPTKSQRKNPNVGMKAGLPRRNHSNSNKFSPLSRNLNEDKYKSKFSKSPRTKKISISRREKRIFKSKQISKIFDSKDSNERVRKIVKMKPLGRNDLKISNHVESHKEISPTRNQKMNLDSSLKGNTSMIRNRVSRSKSNSRVFEKDDLNSQKYPYSKKYSLKNSKGVQDKRSPYYGTSLLRNKKRGGYMEYSMRSNTYQDKNKLAISSSMRGSQSRERSRSQNASYKLFEDTFDNRIDSTAKKLLANKQKNAKMAITRSPDKSRSNSRNQSQNSYFESNFIFSLLLICQTKARSRNL